MQGSGGLGNLGRTGHGGKPLAFYMDFLALLLLSPVFTSKQSPKPSVRVDKCKNMTENFAKVVFFLKTPSTLC